MLEVRSITKVYNPGTLTAQNLAAYREAGINPQLSRLYDSGVFLLEAR